MCTRESVSSSSSESGFISLDVPRSTPGNSEVFDSVIAIMIFLRKYDKSMSGLVCNCIPFLERRVTNK